MHLLDTDILSHISDGTPRVVARLEAAEDNVCTSIVTQMELLEARYGYLRKAENGQHLLRAQHWLDRTIALLEQFLVLPIDSHVATKFDALRGLRKLRKIGRSDLLIASIALAHDAVLVTRNGRDFENVPGIKLENWVD
jgi:tRNA(fMet)-specific endonuclease VapC